MRPLDSATIISLTRSDIFSHQKSFCVILDKIITWGSVILEVAHKSTICVQFSRTSTPLHGRAII